jgi:transcriptional regulator with XRE-family HTH domain
MLSSVVGQQIRNRRLELGLTQRQVSRGINRTRAYVSAIERGVDWDPDADVLVAMARTLFWPGNHILRMLGRPWFPGGAGGIILGRTVLAAIEDAVCAEVARVVFPVALPGAGRHLDEDRRSVTA